VAAAEPLAAPGAQFDSEELAGNWRRFGRSATLVVLLTSPSIFIWFWSIKGWALLWSLLATFLVVIAARGVLDVLMRRVIPWPSLFGTDDARRREQDVVDRRRAWFWRFWIKVALLLSAAISIVFLIKLIRAAPGETVTWPGTAGSILGGIGSFFSTPAIWLQAFLLLGLFLANFLLFMGPLLLMGITQIRGYEPGDAEWGVKLDDVRGQAEAKEEVRRVVNLWQSGEHFEEAGGKRERGLLFLGAPGTGKTMLAKAIATGFNSPFVSIPGSGFAQTFIGIDAVIVRYLARKAKKLARKWGGQCIVFIDEIDAVGMRRSSLQGASMTQPTIHDVCFYGPWGALNPSGDLVVESRAWRERLFAQRAPERLSPYPPIVHKVGNLLNQGGMFPGMMGGMGQLALNQLLVTMDGIDNPPFGKRVLTSRINGFLDASYVIPRRVGKLSLRLPPPSPTGAQIYFIGATNVPMENLDPALTRPGRLGRHVWFRTPTKEDRKDIFDLYLGKVAHEEDLDSPTRRDEIARITNGYSPAMIDQICSMALTHSQHEGRERFGWDDLVEAMTTVESGTAIGVEYIPEETRAVAIHEAGHAAAAHVYLKGAESSRISIRMRGGSLGHHQAFEKEERFSRWRSEEMAGLVHALGAMAAERVFYGENSVGVGGDVQAATARAALMVGASAMGPERIDVGGARFADETEEQTRERLMRRFETIGGEIMARTHGAGPFAHDTIGSVLGDSNKRRLAAQILGQAYVTAHNFIAANREAVERIADRVVEKKEIYGDELVELLDRAQLRAPEIDYTKEASWPTL
jgi:ATP-dependent Zn protease